MSRPVLRSVYDLDGLPAEATDVWKNVSPADADLTTTDTYGFGSVLAHPRQPGVLYGFVDEQGCWRSIDSGLSWVRRDDGSVLAGNWGGAIAPDGSYILACTGNTSKEVGGVNVGYTVQRSTDGGLTWNVSAALAGGGHQPYNLDILPSNKNWVIASDHDDGGSTTKFFMSTDQGQTWVDKGTIADGANNIGLSYYAFWVDDTHAIAISQSGTSGGGIFLGTYNPATTNWSWQRVNTAALHEHGTCYPFIDRTYNKFYLPAEAGIFRADLSDLTTWTNVDSQAPAGCVWATPSKLYAGRAFPVGPAGDTAAKLRDDLRSEGNSWSTATDPAIFDNGTTSNGPRMATVTRISPTRLAMLLACWNLGLMRMVVEG